MTVASLRPWPAGPSVHALLQFHKRDKRPSSQVLQQPVDRHHVQGTDRGSGARPVFAFEGSTMTRRLLACSASALHRGFTLIEVMITVAIVGILAAVAYPSYRDNIVRGSLVDGTNGLSSIRAQMERHFQDNRTYASVTGFTTPCAAGTDASRTYGNFLVTCSGTPDATTFTVQAVGSGPANGFTFTIDQLDVRATSAAPTGYNTCTSKWLTKKGAVC
jgi:type IV pilus assembly protein PilE